MGSAALRRSYAVGVIATAIIAVNGPMTALFLSDAARAPRFGRRALVEARRARRAFARRARSGLSIFRWLPQSADAPTPSSSRLWLASRRLKKSGSLARTRGNGGLSPLLART